MFPSASHLTGSSKGASFSVVIATRSRTRSVSRATSWAFMRDPIGQNTMIPTRRTAHAGLINIAKEPPWSLECDNDCLESTSTSGSIEPVKTRARHFRHGKLFTFLAARAAISIAANKFVRATLDINGVLLARLTTISRPVLANINLDFCAAAETGKRCSNQGLARAILRDSPGRRQQTYSGSYR